jgi:hypothetical protein
MYSPVFVGVVDYLPLLRIPSTPRTYFLLDPILHSRFRNEVHPQLLTCGFVGPDAAM